MAKFELYIPLLSDFEGGYVDDPDDLGGATNMGITYRTYCEFMRSEGLLPTKEKFKAMSVDLRNKIIKVKFWDYCKADEINNQSLAVAIVDWYVNSGLHSVLAVQRILNLKRDGIVGPVTLGGINNANSKDLFEAIQKARIAFIYQICIDRPQNNKYKNGWLNRINKIKFAH